MCFRVADTLLRPSKKYSESPSENDNDDEWLGGVPDETDALVLHRYFEKHADKIGKELLSHSKAAAEADNMSVPGKKAWDQLCALLVDLGQSPELPRYTALSAAQHPAYKDIMARFAHRSTSEVAESLVEGPTQPVSDFSSSSDQSSLTMSSAGRTHSTHISLRPSSRRRRDGPDYVPFLQGATLFHNSNTCPLTLPSDPHSSRQRETSVPGRHRLYNVHGRIGGACTVVEGSGRADAFGDATALVDYVHSQPKLLGAEVPEANLQPVQQ